MGSADTVRFGDAEKSREGNPGDLSILDEEDVLHSDILTVMLPENRIPSHVVEEDLADVSQWMPAADGPTDTGGPASVFPHHGTLSTLRQRCGDQACK
jgi:hypothetical protein